MTIRIPNEMIRQVNNRPESLLNGKLGFTIYLGSDDHLIEATSMECHEDGTTSFTGDYMNNEKIPEIPH